MNSDPVSLLTDAERAQLAAERAAAHWYDGMVRDLTTAQERTAAAHAAISAALGTIAVTYHGAADRIAAMLHEVAAHLETVADAHAALARAVPDSAQAAADLGTAAERHEVAGLRGVVMGEQELAGDLARRLAAIEAQLALGARQRVLILQALGATEGGA